MIPEHIEPTGAVPDSRVARAARRHVRACARDESGGLIVFALFMLVLMLIAGGIAVDTMRFESERTRLQATADTAALAAASLSQLRDPEEVVNDYFAKAGMAEHLDSIEVDEGLNYRSVRVSSSAPMRTLFMRMVGINELTVPGTGAAEERITNVEVSLVLDLSGSMNDYNRLENLQDAAGDFVDTLLGDNPDGQISISIVPYTGQVNAGPHILSSYNVDHAQGFSHCIDFGAGDYSTTALPPAAPLNGAGHGFPWEYTTYYNRYDPEPPFYDCPVAPGNAGLEVLAYQANPEVLRGRIDDMRALGATSIDIGMKWGAALLDPSMQPVISDMIAAGQVTDFYEGRPYDFDEPDTMKVVVLMTDGENFEERRLIDAVKSGPSNVWINENDDTLDTYSLYSASRDEYWWRRDGDWHDAPYGAEPEEICTGSWWYRTCTWTDGNSERRLGYPELWHRASMYWVARNIYAAAEGYSHNYAHGRAAQWVNSWTDATYPNAKDDRLQQVCGAAKGNGMVVFSVAFEATGTGVSGLRNCASTSAHFFDVEGLEVRSAFRAIALQISQLRLTQ